MHRELELIEEMKKRCDLMQRQIDFNRSLQDEPPGTILECMALQGWNDFNDRICDWTGRLIYEKGLLKKEIKNLEDKIKKEEEEMMKDAGSLLRG